MKKKYFSFLIVLLFGIILIPNQAKAQLETIPTGSYIMDMGITPQTIGNGLKPYGLVYHLVRFENVPIKWSINPSKIKDGTDFIYNGYEYKGGPFIIPANFRNARIDSIISAWETLGVVGVTTTSDINVPVYKTLTFFPTWTLDQGSGGKVIPYFGNSGIPEDAYKFNETQFLDCCDDIFILPHSDPTWSTHSNLFYWNAAISEGGCEGWIWSACHGVSVLEAIVGPGGEKMNFLSNDPGTVDFGDHDGGTMPYSYDHPTEPFMQFMEILDGATENGSEQIYLPITTWRPSTKIGVYDPDHPDIPAISQGPAAKVAFGHAFGDVDRGQVMFEGGHSHDNGDETELVAAQRVFFNFCFLAPAKSVPEIISHTIPLVVQSGEVLNLTATAVGASTSGLTYEWFDVCGGTFDNPFIQSPVFTAPIVTEAVPCAITVRATDECGRVGFLSQEVTVVPAPAPPVAVNDNDTTPPYLPVDVDVLDNDTDINLDPLTVTGFVGSPSIPGEGTFSINPDGTVRFTPIPTFTGSSSIDYIVCDTTSRCDTATVTIEVAYPDSDGDGITDDVDVDDDNDGILDTDYYGGTDPSADTDADGFPNYVDTDYPGFVDVNNDGVNDNFDTDLDGLADHLDLDADNDGIPDAIEANGGVAPAGYDPLTGSISGAVDASGLPVAAAGGYTLNDFDGDGILDVLDLDSDNDGIADIVEAGGEDADGNGIADNFTDANGDGMDDALLASPLPIPNTDGTGSANFLDIDSDDDGITDNQEAQSTAGYVAPLGTDTDGDGWDDAYDSDNGGTAIVILDFDEDTTPDYMDTDSDNDSVLDDIEGHDADGNGISDIGACVLGTDTDSDGLDDCYDTGNVTWDATASNAPTQNTDGSVDLDWRDVDDDDDGKLTLLDQGDLNENGIPDYLESACDLGFIAIPLLDTAYASSTVSCYVGGSQSTICDSKILGPEDNNSTGDIKNTNDSIVMQMDAEVVSNSLVIIHNKVFESNAGMSVHISEDNMTWTVINSGVTIDSLAGLDYIFVAPETFNYIELHYNGSGGKIQWDAIEARIGLVSFAASSDSCIINGSSNTTCNTEATGLNDGNATDQLKVVGDLAQFLMNDKVFAGSDVKCFFETIENDMDIVIQISLDKSSWTLVDTISSADVDANDNYLFNTTASFNYIRFIHQGLGGKKLEIDAIETSKALDKCIDAIEAVNDTVQHYENYTQEIAVQANDMEGLGNLLTTIQYTTPSNGTILLNGDSTFSYTPNANFNGTDSFEYIICNPSNICDTALVFIYVDSIPCYEGRAPEVYTLNKTEYADSVDTENSIGNSTNALGATDNSAARLNGAGDILILKMSRDIPAGLPGSTLKIYELDGGSRGNIRISPDKVTWTTIISDANPGNPGTFDINIDWRYIEFTRTNGNFDIDAVEAIFDEDSIVCYNPPPVALDDDTTTSVNTPVTIDVLINDADPYEDTLQVTATLNGPSNGTVTINPDYSITYTPDSGFTGNDSFEYIVCDTVNPAACDTALVSILIPNNQPIAVDDADSTEANTPVDVPVLVNDTDPDGGNLIVSAILVPPVFGGNASINGTGGITFTPAPGFQGTDSLVYIVCDDGTPTQCDTASVTVFVEPLINDAPTAVNDTAITEINEVIAIPVLNNDTDPENNPLTVDTASAPAHGTIFVDAVGNVIYTPDSAYIGPDTITYIVCDNGFPPLCDTATVFITVSASINDAPLVTDDNYNAYDGFTSTYTVIDNDVDLDGEIDSTTVTILSGPSFGGALNNVDGTIDYLPNPGYSGADTIVYSVCDDGVPLPVLCDTATVYINVALVNAPPVAVDDYDTTAINDPLHTPVVQNDTDPEGGPLTVTINSTPSNGSVSINPNNSITYISTPGFIGDDSYTYQLCDDGGQCDIATVFVHIPNDAPIAIFDQENTLQDVDLTIDVTANDAEPNFDTLIVTGAGTDAANGSTSLGGSVSINPDGTVNYSPPASISGIDTFYYSVCDGAVVPACDTTYVLVTINSNEPPVALDDGISTIASFPTVINVIANDFDLTGQIDSSSVSVPAGMQPTNGTVIVNGDGSVTYISNLGLDTIDTFQYIVCDNASPSLCDTATVTVNVSNDNVPPIALNDAGNVTFDDTLIINVLSNDVDPNGNIQEGTLSIVVPPLHGSTSVNLSTGEITYIPDSNYLGIDSYQYVICDTLGLCDTATVNINVTIHEICGNGLDDDLDGFIDCSDGDCQTITAEPILTPTPFACVGDSGLSYYVNPVPNATNYTWTVPSGSVIISGQGSPSVTITWGEIPGQICVTADAGGCAATTECESFQIARKQPVPQPIMRLN